MSFAQHLKATKEAKGVLVMDGGTGSEIGKRAPDSLHDDCWTGAVHLEYPDIVEAVHADYMKAGAQVVITNTYASNRHCLEAAGLEDRCAEATAKACACATSARHKMQFNKNFKCFLCGSMSTHPPEFKEAVVRSASFRGDATKEAAGEAQVETANPTAFSRWPSQMQEIQNFSDQAMGLKEGGCDAIALEMVKDVHHGSMIVKGAAASGLPVLLGVSVLKKEGVMYLRDDLTAPLTDNLKKLLALCPNIVCINIMHTPPEWISDGIIAARSVWSGAIGCYPNNGNAMSWPQWQEGDCTPEQFVELARDWRRQGATIIGGCCGIGVDHIRALVADLEKDKIQAKL